jgi:membrane protease YdiL (CAAX protease family)
MESPAEAVDAGPACARCGSALMPTASFCTACGQAVALGEDAGQGWRDTKRFFWAFGLVALYILGSYLVEEWTDYRAVLAWDAAFFLLVAGVSVFFSRALGGALVPRAISLDRLFTYLIAQAVLSFVVISTGPWLNRAFGLEELSYSAIFYGSPHPLLLTLLSTAFFPAITEELAFRGLFFGQLQRLMGGASVVIVSAILFATVHFAMLSMYWLLPAGLLFGWIRHREGHIWWGVLLHMSHNALVVWLEFNPG